MWSEATQQYEQCTINSVPEQRDRQQEENRQTAYLRCCVAQGEPQIAINGLQPV